MLVGMLVGSLAKAALTLSVTSRAVVVANRIQSHPTGN